FQNHWFTRPWSCGPRGYRTETRRRTNEAPSACGSTVTSGLTNCESPLVGRRTSPSPAWHVDCALRTCQAFTTSDAHRVKSQTDRPLPGAAFVGGGWLPQVIPAA